MSKVTTIIFQKSKWTTSRARNWLNRHGYTRLKKVHITANTLRYVVHDTPPNHRSFITKKFGKDSGIVAVISI